MSAEPTVCTVDRPDRPDGLDPLPPRMVDNAVRDVRMVILRENIHSPRNGKTDREARREYSHRFIVRGFWRNQAYGKNHELRRRQWIPPFVKGPADKLEGIWKKAPIKACFIDFSIALERLGASRGQASTSSE